MSPVGTLLIVTLEPLADFGKGDYDFTLQNVFHLQEFCLLVSGDDMV